MNKDRFEAFSDGVFAFAITLLVLGFVLPVFKTPPSDADLRGALLGLWPNLIAYALSFAVIGIMWQNHQAFTRLVRRVDRMTVFLNHGLLAATVFIPFATSVLGSYPNLRSAAFLYGLTLTACSIFFNLIPEHVIRAGNLSPDVPPEMIARTRVAYRTGLVTYAGATIISLFFPVASFVLYVLIVAYYLVPRGVDSDLPESS